MKRFCRFGHSSNNTFSVVHSHGTLALNSACTSDNSTSILVSSQQIRTRFYRPVLNSGWNQFKKRFGMIHNIEAIWDYKHIPMDPKPKKEIPVNTYWGEKRIWNAIPSKIGIVNKKAEEWDYPYRQPPPAGLRRSKEYFPHYFNQHFPNIECRLVIDSVLNNETKNPVFHFPMHMSRLEIRNYLKNVYQLDNIISVRTRNIKGRYFKNEVGTIKSMPDYKEAIVKLDAPVKVDFKQIQGTEDAPDSKKLK
eukprot:Tbor_TRINITY_DN2913_c0_g1::TRINITY_DN2913_c0_g1_i1::g.1081::m.1081